MFELTLNSEIAVKLQQLKKQANTELNKSYSIKDEAHVESLLLDTCRIEEPNSIAHDIAMEVIDKLEALDTHNRNADFIDMCKGRTKHTLDKKKKTKKGVSFKKEQPETNNTQHKTKDVYYRGKKILSDTN